jgi:phage host-nuclease inhibitor protein Gam
MAKKTDHHTLETFEEVDQALLRIGQSESRIAKAEAQMNAKIQELRDAFEQQTAEDRSTKIALEKDVETFCLTHKPEFDATRTKQLVHGTVGFRTTPPKVGFLNRKYNAQTAVELIKKILKGLYVRTVEEINKEAILTDYAAREITDDQLAAVGLRVDQSEKFSYEVKWDELEAAA